MTNSKNGHRAQMAALVGAFVAVALGLYIAIDRHAENNADESDRAQAFGEVEAARPVIANGADDSGNAESFPPHSARSLTSREAARPSASEFRPSELYAKYLAGARGGDPDAQIVLVAVLAECRTSVKSASALERVKQEGMPPDVVEVATARYLRCKSLRDAVPDLDSEYETWESAARENKHPLLLVGQRNVPIDEKRRLLRTAISEEYPERFLYGKAYLEAAAYFREYAEKRDLFREEAWLLIYCDVSPNCDGQKEREFLRNSKYQQYQFDEIQSVEKSILESMKQHDWDALGF